VPDPFREITEAEVRRLLPLWDAGEFAGLPGERGGTANPAVVVETLEGRLFLKRRNPRYSAPEVLRHDHALMEHLAAKGFPAPLALRSRDGRRWTEADGEIEKAGRCLAAFHAATADFEPPPGKEWPRYHDPAKTAAAMEWALAELEPTPGERDQITQLRAIADALASGLPDDRYWSFPGGLVHGDWHPANVKYARWAICGVFDLDWATRQPRMVDVADGIIFFAGVRRVPLDAGDIRSLTQTFALEPERTEAFLRGYGRGRAMAAREMAALPDFMLARWLYCRADPMQRKVAPAEAVTFLLDGIWPPIEAIRSLRDVTSTLTGS
jgi:homoserine kinase type II